MAASAGSAAYGAVVAELAVAVCRNGDERSGNRACRLAVKKCALFDPAGRTQLVAAGSTRPRPRRGPVDAGRRHLAATCMMPVEWPLDGEIWEDYVRACAEREQQRSQRLDRSSVPEPELAGLPEARDVRPVGDVGGTARDYVAPRTGRVLVATRKVDSHPLYSKAVVLLFGPSDDDNCRLRGLILNKALPPAMATTLAPDAVGAFLALGNQLSPEAEEEFRSAATYLGGPLTSCPRLHILTKRKGLRGFERVMPELYLGDVHALQSVLHSSATGYMPVTDAKLYLGQVEWTTEQLACEIDLHGWWEVAEGNPSDFTSCSSQEMWRHFDQLYSRQVKLDGHVSATDSAENLSHSTTVSSQQA